jgi:hypothetical protein
MMDECCKWHLQAENMTFFNEIQEQLCGMCGTVIGPGFKEKGE